MPTPATTSARRHNSNLTDYFASSPSSPPAYRNHGTPAATAAAAAKQQTDNPSGGSTNDPPAETTTVHASLLQPRVAVALGLSAKWHPLLFVCRLMSILPALRWGLPVALGLLAQAILFLAGDGSSSNNNGNAVCAADGKTLQQAMPWLRGYSRLPSESSSSSGTAANGFPDSAAAFETRLRITENVLGIIWCASSAYLSFFFTDCLMSRWLLLYTPQATLVRLLTTAATNLYLTTQALRLTGAAADERLLLPAWVTIATALTGLYHLTQRKINIRKETRLTVSVFSIASFASMVALLANLLAARPGPTPAVPLLDLAAAAWEAGRRAWDRVAEGGSW